MVFLLRVTLLQYFYSVKCKLALHENMVRLNCVKMFSNPSLNMDACLLQHSELRLLLLPAGWSCGAISSRTGREKCSGCETRVRVSLRFTSSSSAHFKLRGLGPSSFPWVQHFELLRCWRCTIICSNLGRIDSMLLVLASLLLDMDFRDLLFPIKAFHQRFTGGAVTLLLGYLLKETLHCYRVTSVVFSDDCSSWTCTGHYTLYLLLMTVLLCQLSCEARVSECLL